MSEQFLWSTALIELGPSLENYDKNIWTEEEIYTIYAIMNAYDGTSVPDTKCGSCRRHAIARVRNIWHTFKNQQKL